MRKPRHLVADGHYHVSARVNHREHLLTDPDTKNLLVQVIDQAILRFGFRLENLCIMDNHVHLLIHTPRGANLSEIMKWILGTFAVRWNRSHQAWGHFWGDRFASRVLTTLRQYWAAFRYVDENPVRAGLCQRVEDWWAGRFGIARRMIAAFPEGQTSSGGQSG